MLRFASITKVVYLLGSVGEIPIQLSTIPIPGLVADFSPLSLSEGKTGRKGSVLSSTLRARAERNLDVNLVSCQTSLWR